MRENKNRRMLPEHKLNFSLCAPGPWEGPIGMERAVSAVELIARAESEAQAQTRAIVILFCLLVAHLVAWSIATDATYNSGPSNSMVQ